MIAGQYDQNRCYSDWRRRTFLRNTKKSRWVLQIQAVLNLSMFWQFVNNWSSVLCNRFANDWQIKHQTKYNMENKPATSVYRLHYRYILRQRTWKNVLITEENSPWALFRQTQIKPSTRHNPNQVSQLLTMTNHAKTCWRNSIS